MEGADSTKILNPSAKAPGAQGSVIPLGWTPTPEKPVPVVRCVTIKKDGVRCGRWSIRGHTKCQKHLRGAMNFENVRQHVDAVLEAARLRIVDSADEAIDQLHLLMAPGTSEGIRLKAATEILDRAGIRGGFEIDVEVTQGEDPAEVLQQRLAELRERGMNAINARSADIVDGEIVEDDAPQAETLFDV